MYIFDKDTPELPEISIAFSNATGGFHESGGPPLGNSSVVLDAVDLNTLFSRRTWDSRSRDSSVGTATSYGLDDREVGVRVPVGSRISSSPCRPDRL
jgi:hypothetical protein